MKIFEIFKKKARPFYYKYAYYPLARFGGIKSYSQFSEDLALEQLFGSIGKIIDVGANDGISCSNSLRFLLGGAEGLLFEPTPEIFRTLSLLHARNRKVVCVGEGVSDVSTELEFLVDGLLSFPLATEDKAHTLSNSRFFSKEKRYVRIRVQPLQHWINEMPQFADVDCVSIDVEGHELNVLRGIDFSRFRTRCFIIETHANTDSVKWLHKDYAAIRDLLGSHGYSVGFVSPENSYWLPKSLLNSLDVKGVVKSFSGYARCSPLEYVTGHKA